LLEPDKWLRRNKNSALKKGDLAAVKGHGEWKVKVKKETELLTL
jgi:hypothetical protein